MRARIDVSEIEAQTKIRAKYLRALENEEWDLLPGPTFVKSFLRTYGEALGLDGRALVEEYKLHYEHLGEGTELIQQPSGSAPRRTRPRGGAAARRSAGARAAPRQGPSRRYIAAVGAVGLVIVLLLYALLSGGEGSSSPTASTPTASGQHGGGTARGAGHSTRTSGAAGTTATLASLKLEPSAEIYVCLIGDGRKRIPGLILTPSSPIADLPRAALRTDAGQRRGDADGERPTTHGAGIRERDRVRDHPDGDASVGGERTADVQMNGASVTGSASPASAGISAHSRCSALRTPRGIPGGGSRSQTGGPGSRWASG